MLPELSGMEVLKAVREDPRTADIPVIMLTAKSAESDIVVGLHMGADDYVTKPFSMSVLKARIAAVLRRREGGSADTSLLSAGPVLVNLHTHQVLVNGDAVSLTLTEFRLLAAIISSRGRVLTRDQLIDRAIGADAVVMDRTIDVHLTALRRKLGSARKIIQTVRGVGYRLASESDEKA
jgi:DNA-binding response OmpR family regulator